MENSSVFDDDSPPEPKEGWLLVRIHVPELNVYKCLQFPSDRLVWDVKQQVLASLPKELKESFNYGLFCPPSNGKAGKFLDEERRLGDYPFNGPVGYLELKYKRRVYKMLNLDERQLKALHTRANLRRFLDCINGGHVEKIAKMCAKGLDPNFHCPESGDTPLTVATGAKKPNKLLIALVNGGAILDYRTKDGTTALHKAVERDSLEAVTTLLELGASPNYKDVRGLTPVYLSITKKCDPKITESLLHDHATLGTPDTQGWQEVHQACRHGLIHHLEHLLSYGADMDGHNASGNTPLHVCAVNNQEACARMLLFRGAQRGALNYANQTPYQVAVIAGNMELAEMIQNFKSDEIVPFRGPPRYNPRRRSGLGWQMSSPTSTNHLHHLYIQHPQQNLQPHHYHHHHQQSPPIHYHQQTSLYSDHSGPGSIISTGSLLSTLTSRNSLCIIGGPPSPCPSEHMPYSSASSSLSEGSSGHRSHEDDISIVTDKSLGDTSDIISDSSGVGTNSDSAACSIGHPSTTVVCMEAYSSNEQGHLRLQPGDVIEVVGSTDCGYLEGYVRGTNRSGFFPGECVQEVSIRQKNITNVSTANTTSLSPNPQRTTAQPTSDNHQMNGNGSQYSSATAPRIKKPQTISFSTMAEQRTVILHRAKRGFGFVLRGAKASSPLMQLKPSERFPALQYLDGVDPGGVADMAGLKPGDFLLTINGEDVRAASHEQVVEMIRSSGALVSMTVISPHFQTQLSPQQLSLQQQPGAMSPTQQNPSRQCATLPRKMSMGPGGKAAPAPPRRDPKTTLSVGRARAKSMVAGLENGGEKDDEDMPTTKSNSVESITHSGTPSLNPGTPTQMRTASIKSRPSSSRITAAELEELFQRQQGENADTTRFSTMMTTSRFQSGTDSGTTTPPVNGSPMKSSGPIVYGSVAEMKRKKTKNVNNGYGTLRGKPCAIPTVGGDLKRFHSTPDLNTKLSGSDVSIWNHAGANSAKGHHSQDDVATLHASLQRLNLPPPTHPPPPPPVGQVVKVDVSRASEYESTLALQQALKKRAELAAGNKNPGEIASTFKPSTNAKLYASPQELKNMGWKDNTNQQQANNGTLQRKHVPQSPQPTAQNQSQYARPTIVTNSQVAAAQPQVQQPQQIYQPPIVVDGGNVVTVNGNMVPQGPAPPIPDPDYSLSEDESDGDDENSILVARNTKLNEKIALIDVPDNGNASANNGTPPATSMSHSFSVEEIQKMRTKLKTSKSYPNDLLAKEKEEQEQGDKEKVPEKVEEPQKPQEQQPQRAVPGEPNEENGSDNSSSGVSSDQDIPANNTDTIKKKPAPAVVPVAPAASNANNVTPSVTNQVQSTKVKSCIIKSQQLNLNPLPIMASKMANTTTAVPKKPILKNPLNVTRSPQPVHHEVKNGLDEEQTRSDEEYYDDAELSPSPPSKPFQRHNSLTRKQAATIAMNRATVTTARPAVSLVQLPPPIEGDNEHDVGGGSAAARLKIATTAPDNEIVLAPPPQFCDCQHKQQHVHLQRQPHHHQPQQLLQPQPQHFQPHSHPHHQPHQQQQQQQHLQQQQHQLQQLQAQQRVRIVGAVPKANYRLHSQ